MLVIGLNSELLLLFSNTQDPRLFLKSHKHIGTVDNPTALRTAYYPPLDDIDTPKEGQLRCGEHADYGGITLLFQETEPGLEVQISSNQGRIENYQMSGGWEKYVSRVEARTPIWPLPLPFIYLFSTLSVYEMFLKAIRLVAFPFKDGGHNNILYWSECQKVESFE